MATAPTFATIPNAGTPAVHTTGNNQTDGANATGRALVFTAGASGSFLPFLRAKPMGTNVQTVLRVWINNGSDPNVPGNNSLIAEQTIQNSGLSANSSMPSYDVPVGTLAPSWRVYTAIGTTVSAGLAVTPMNGGNL